MSRAYILYIYIYIYIEREREERELKNKVIKTENSYVKESQRYNVSVIANHHQDLDGCSLEILNYRWIIYIYIYVYDK